MVSHTTANRPLQQIAADGVLNISPRKGVVLVRPLGEEGARALQRIYAATPSAMFSAMEPFLAVVQAGAAILVK
jgi:DNA-binding GntR family transcriptional regulator